MQRKMLRIGEIVCFFVMALFVYANAEEKKKVAPPANVWHVNVHDSVVRDNWTNIPPAIERLYTKNLDPDVNPTSYLNFERDKSLTKGELAVMIVKLMNKQQEVQQYRQKIASLKNQGSVSPYSGWVETCLKYGYMNDKLIPNWSMDKGFNPDGTITRGEVLVTLIKLLNDIYPESLGQEGIIAPPELDKSQALDMQHNLVSLADLWQREKNGRFVHGILAEAIALNRKFKGGFGTHPYDEPYSGFILTAKKYLLESSPDDRSLAQGFMSDVYGITSKGKINSQSVAKRYWACLLFSKCFVGEFVPTNRKVAVSGDQKAVDEPTAYGIFQDNWDLVGRIGTITKGDMENNILKVIKNNGETIELKIFEHSYIYALCPQKATTEERRGKIYAPDNDVYQDDKDINNRGYKRFYWSLLSDNHIIEVPLDNKNTYRPLMKIYREATRAISPNEGYKMADFSEKRECLFGFTGNPQRFDKEIAFVDVDIERAADLHWGLYHNERVEMTIVNEPCEYKTGKQFLSLTPYKANKLYQGKIIRAYFVPNRQTHDQLPIKNYAGFIEITPDDEWSSWHSICSNKYPISCKSWFDLKGKCTMIDTKLSADVFRIDTDDYTYDADDMGEEPSPILIPLGYKYFLAPAKNTQDKLKGFQFCKPDMESIMEQQFYIQLDEKGRVRFLEADVVKW